MTRKVTIVVESADRLDRALAAGVADVSRRQARAAIAAGAVFVEGHRCRVASRSVSAGARIVAHLNMPDEGRSSSSSPSPARTESPFWTPPPIIWRGGDLFAVDKPPGLHVNETETSARASVVSAFGGRAHPVHRLDRDTSGVLLLARSNTAAAAASKLFERRAVEKTYWAVVHGASVPSRIEAPIGLDRRRPRARAVRDDGKPACTEVTPLGHGAAGPATGFVGEAELAGLEVRPLTGRTHQIRVHLSHAGCPIVGDVLYGGPAASRWRGQVVRWPRIMLHAVRLSFRWDGIDVELTAARPADFAPFGDLGLPSSWTDRTLSP